MQLILFSWFIFTTLHVSDTMNKCEVDTPVIQCGHIGNSDLIQSDSFSDSASNCNASLRNISEVVLVQFEDETPMAPSNHSESEAKLSAAVKVQFQEVSVNRCYLKTKI